MRARCPKCGQLYARVNFGVSYRCTTCGCQFHLTHRLTHRPVPERSAFQDLELFPGEKAIADLGSKLGRKLFGF